MITQLTSKDIPAIKDYLSQDAEQNLFFLADIENYSLDDSENIEVFANVPEHTSEQWDFLLLRYFTVAIIYSRHNHFNVDTAVRILKTFPILDSIGGKDEIVCPLKDFFPTYRFRPCTLLTCTRKTLQNHTLPVNSDVKLCTVSSDESDDLVDFYLSIDEFAKNYAGQEERFRERTRENLKKDSTAYVFKDIHNKKIIASVQAGAQCSTGTMLLGIATHNMYRKRRLATNLILHACADQFQKGRDFISLFFDNPDAESLYKKVGFSNIGTYSVLLHGCVE
ncbi:MAG: GNAT family N-acetyltransferase [Spirochaetales bacterium]